MSGQTRDCWIYSKESRAIRSSIPNFNESWAGIRIASLIQVLDQPACTEVNFGALKFRMTERRLRLTVSIWTWKPGLDRQLPY